MAKASPLPDEPRPAPEPRGARRKRETRARLLEAALELMAQRGLEGVAINEITEAADVGFGSFYNHFKSKEAIYEVLIDTVFEEFADALDRLIADITDPAEIISVCVRHTVLRAAREPVWGRFLIREGLSAHVLTRGLGLRLQRDIRKGLASGRFRSDDPQMSFMAVGGTVLTAISAQMTLDPAALHAGLPPHAPRALDQRTAAMLLRTLGLPAAEADAIACRPLP